MLRKKTAADVGEVCCAAVHYLSTTWISEVSFLISVFFCCLAFASCSKLSSESYFNDQTLSNINYFFVLCLGVWIRVVSGPS